MDNQNLFESTYNPDVLSCIANLSNDEVFTPPEIANKMLDMLPQELFKSSKTKFLDPACKSGVFLREIAKRLLVGLQDEIPDLQERINHIFKNQVFGIAITELTSLLSRRSVYCSKYPNCKYSVCQFDENDAQGNIYFSNIKHQWINGKCLHCGASQKEYSDEKRENLESHAYQFIHKEGLGKLENMKFDVIIGNPPYQMSTGGQGRQAKPLYHLFIQQAKKLNPRYMSFIIPARWYAGGFGLDNFRKEMLDDNRLKYLIDYPNASDVFSGVDIAGGVCYFLWDGEYNGDCEISNVIDNKKITARRKLNEYSTFIRYNQAITIVRKILDIEKPIRTLENTVSPQRPFGLPTNYQPKETGVPCWFIQKIGKKFATKEDISDYNNLLNKWKLLVPKAPIAGQTDFTKAVCFYYDGNTKIAKPGECCTESFIVVGNAETKEEILNFKSYLFTKLIRFLLLQTVISQDVLRNKFCFIPALERYDHQFTDSELCERWKITNEEWDYIDSRIYDIE